MAAWNDRQVNRIVYDKAHHYLNSQQIMAMKSFKQSKNKMSKFELSNTRIKSPLNRGFETNSTGSRPQQTGVFGQIGFESN